MPASYRRVVAAFLLALVLAGPVSATWSIVIVNLVTGEVGIGIATCLSGFDLQPNAMVVVPGFGVAAAQSFVGPLSLRELIRAQLLAGTPPAQILQLLATQDGGHQTRQYGIAAAYGGAVTFTGLQAFAWAGGVTGQTGDYVYAIQGNILTGSPVVTAAEAALIATSGDMAEKLMAAMDAARLMGGDGRCSCSSTNPTGCGAPPAFFQTSALCGSIIVSRPGDPDALCNGGQGCTAGVYYMDLNVANQPSNAVDAVLQLQSLFNQFRQAKLGKADHFLSTVTFATPELRADGVDQTTARVTLRDWQGTPLASGGALVTVAVAPGSPAPAGGVGAVVDNGDGTYDFSVTAGTVPGTLRLRVLVDEGNGPIRLGPDPEIEVGSPFGPAGEGTVDAPGGGLVDLLRVNGSSGFRRVVMNGVAQPVTLSFDAPPASSGGALYAAHFVLFAKVGAPQQADLFPLSPAIGTLVFAPPPLTNGPGEFVVADSFGPLPMTVYPAPPTPWIATLPGGLPAAVDLMLQGVVIENPPVGLAVTNAVHLRTVLLPPPSIAAVTPSNALPGTSVTVTGQNFQPGIAVVVGGQQAAPSAITATSVVFTMPAGAGCAAVLSLTNVDGQSAQATMNPNPLPVIIPYPSGPAAGGTLFVVIGSNLLGATATIGGVPAALVANSATALAVTTPPGTPGPTTVVITSPAGCTATVAYTYL